MKSISETITSTPCKRSCLEDWHAHPGKWKNNMENHSVTPLFEMLAGQSYNAISIGLPYGACIWEIILPADCLVLFISHLGLPYLTPSLLADVDIYLHSLQQRTNVSDFFMKGSLSKKSSVFFCCFFCCCSNPSLFVCATVHKIWKNYSFHKDPFIWNGHKYELYFRLNNLPKERVFILSEGQWKWEFVIWAMFM